MSSRKLPSEVHNINAVYREFGPDRSKSVSHFHGFLSATKVLRCDDQTMSEYL
jgi:hypothetical protein